MGIIADGLLLDVLRRIKCFGVHLVRLDIRQESTRHSDVISELTRYLGSVIMSSGASRTRLPSWFAS